MSSHSSLFSGHIEVSLKTAASVLAAYPDSASAYRKVAKGLTKAEAIRAKYAREGVEIPPLLIASTTDRCNLSCAGCYACAHNRPLQTELEDTRIAEILNEASALGISVVMLAGGEPLLSHGWLDALAAHPEMAGIVFTNGTLFEESRIAWFAKHRHIIPAFSLEGDEQQTDHRRGAGVYVQVLEAMMRLKESRLPFGISITATSQNINSILDGAFTEDYIGMGCRLFVFVEYVPVAPDSQPLVLSKADKHRLNDYAAGSAKKHPALFIPFPGDETQYGGCLAAGRGFIHISSGGAVEPCPFAPFSDTNLKHTTLKEALSSAFLAEIRNNHHLLKEGDGGCALWHNREWLATLKKG